MKRLTLQGGGEAGPGVINLLGPWRWSRGWPPAGPRGLRGQLQGAARLQASPATRQLAQDRQTSQWETREAASDRSCAVAQGPRGLLISRALWPQGGGACPRPAPATLGAAAFWSWEEGVSW